MSARTATATASDSILDLRQWPWSTTLLRAAIAALAIRWLAPHVWPPASQALASELAWGASCTLIALRWLAGLPEGAGRARRARRAGRSWLSRLVVLLIPVELIGSMRLALVTAGACVAWLARRRPAPRPAGLRLEDRRKGFYDGLFALNVISLVVEFPLMMLVLSGIHSHPGLHGVLHAIEIAAIVAVLGDRWLVLAGGHVLTDSHLDLCAGARARARIPLDAIEAIDLAKDWNRTHRARRADTGTVSVLDKPNVVITLHPAPGLAWTHFQVERPLPRHLFVYLDHPDALAPAVASARARRAASA
jgi:hypothetical protein